MTGTPDDDTDLWNEVVEFAPDHFDGDDALEAIVIRYVRALEAVANAARDVERGGEWGSETLSSALHDLDGTWP
jgi:hypothetical protein